MEPSIIQKPEMKFVGMSYFGDPFVSHNGWDQNNEIGRLWVRFFDYLKSNMDGIPNLESQDALYEMHVYGGEMFTIGHFEAYVGIEVKTLDAVPLELQAKIIPASRYAVFTLVGEQITEDWHLTVDKWIVKAGHQRDESFSLQVYDQRFKGQDRIAESVLDVWLPLANSHEKHE